MGDPLRWPGLDLLGGIIVIAYPGIGGVTLAVIVAIVLVLNGGRLVAESLALRTL